MNLFKRFPLATLAAWGTAVLAVLVYLQASGALTGSAARWTALIAGALQVLLTLYARTKVTPVADPKDDIGRPLVPANKIPPPR